jgi:hypothetical protein
MTDAKTQKIAELNDLARKAMGVGGRLVITPGIAALSDHAKSEVIEKVQTFDAFTEDNDPYGERDFGNFDYDGQKIFWKIDYYDKAVEYGSVDPADASKTTRVLTIMLASEY